MYNTDTQRQLFDLSKELLKSTEQLNATEAQTESEQLHSVLVYHEWRYSIKNDPVISDFEYDTLYKRLEALEQWYPDLISPESPTQRVSNDLTEDFPSVEHLVPMLSLANSYNEEDLVDFDTQIKKLCGLEAEVKIEYTVEPKYDGGSIALVYENDALVRAATRGNGALGEEMTNNARTMKSVPLKANFSARQIAKVELRGEVVIRKDHFVKMNKAR